MKQKLLWGIIGILFVANLAFIYMLWEAKQPASPLIEAASPEQALSIDVNEVVAEVNEEKITHHQWLDELTKTYGEAVLADMINKRVVDQLAEDQGITITEEAVNKEIALLKSMYISDFDSDESEKEFQSNEAAWREDIEYTLLLEELLTRDVVISESELKDYYEANRDLFNLPAGVELSHIVVPTREEALQVIEELEGGSSFMALAMERSIDDFTASHGGSLGFVPLDASLAEEQYLEAVKELTKGEWSAPIEVETGYAIVLLKNRSEGTHYSFDDAKDQIRRQLALSQMNGEFSPEMFWDQAGVTWIYQKEQ